MSVDYLLNDSGDMTLINGVVQFTDTIEASSRQQVLISLSTYRGEWDFNILAGIPWVENENNTIKLLGKVDKRLIDSYIKEDILNRENITEITSYASVLDKTTRELSISFVAVTNEGSTVVVDDNVLSLTIL
jgi:hypothetical protein